jgi:hypothetical protein
MTAIFAASLCVRVCACVFSYVVVKGVLGIISILVRHTHAQHQDPMPSAHPYFLDLGPLHRTAIGRPLLLELDSQDEGKALVGTTSGAGDGLFPAGRYPTAFAVGISQLTDRFPSRMSSK